MAISPVTAVLEIANTEHGPSADLGELAPDPGSHDHLADAAAAQEYLARRGLAVPDRPPEPAHLERLRELRAAAHAVAAHEDTASERVERLLRRYTYRLMPDGSLEPTASGWDGLVAAAVPGLVDLEAAGDRVHSCANSECRWLFIDQSRNRSRVWCDMGTCGSRAKMTRYRERRNVAVEPTNDASDPA